MECVIVQDLFLNETAKFAHVFLPGSSFLEKDGTFVNAERRINRVRAVMPSKAGMQEWEATQALAQAMGYPMNYASIEEIVAEIAELTPTFAGVNFEVLDREGSVQWPCNADAPQGTPVMHEEKFVRGKGLFVLTEFQPHAGARQPQVPTAPDHGPQAQPVQTSARRHDVHRTSSG